MYSLFISYVLGNRQDFNNFMEHSDHKIKVYFVSDELQTLEIVFKDYFKKEDLLSNSEMEKKIIDSLNHFI